MQTSQTGPADRRTARVRLGAITALLALPALLIAQSSVTATTGTTSTGATSSASAFDYTQYFKLTSVPPVLQSQAAALGDRLQKPGNERITMTGTLTDPSGTSPVQIIIQNGGKLNLTFLASPVAGGSQTGGVGGTQAPGVSGVQTGATTPITTTASTPVIFNGATASGATAQSNQDGVLESFVDDLADTLMLTASHGIGLRMLGQRFQDSTGAECDLYDVPIQGQTTGQREIKRYCFDSTSQLLRYVQYIEGSNRLETRFGNWQRVIGQAAPGTVSRFENGVPLFVFQAQTTTISASANDGVFGN
jgi:hypothetical protein